MDDSVRLDVVLDMLTELVGLWYAEPEIDARERIAAAVMRPVDLGLTK